MTNKKPCCSKCSGDFDGKGCTMDLGCPCHQKPCCENLKAGDAQCNDCFDGNHCNGVVVECGHSPLQEHQIITIGNLIGCDVCKKGNKEVRLNPVCYGPPLQDNKCLVGGSCTHKFCKKVLGTPLQEKEVLPTTGARLSFKDAPDIEGILDFFGDALHLPRLLPDERSLLLEKITSYGAKERAEGEEIGRRRGVKFSYGYEESQRIERTRILRIVEGEKREIDPIDEAAANYDAGYNAALDSIINAIKKD